MKPFGDILANFISILMNDFVYKYILPLLLIFIVFDVIGYIFSKEDKKEELFGRIKVKLIGFILILALPYLLIGFASIFERITGIKPNIDSSIIRGLTNKPSQVQQGTNQDTSSTPST